MSRCSSNAGAALLHASGASACAQQAFTIPASCKACSAVSAWAHVIFQADASYPLATGTGHIRFWSMARTFTGLKLQGSIGKFGNEELSDVSGYTDLPDGKVECRMTLPGISCSIMLHMRKPAGQRI